MQPLCWLRSFAPVTYYSYVQGTHSLAASTQHKWFCVYNIDRYAKQRCRLRGTYVHQNGATDSAEYNGSLSRITSTVAPYGTNPQAKAKILTRLEVATRWKCRVLLYEPRAAFYTDNIVKMQKINMHIASTVRKNFQLHFQYNATSIKKSWKSGEELP